MVQTKANWKPVTVMWCRCVDDAMWSTGPSQDDHTQLRVTTSTVPVLGFPILTTNTSTPPFAVLYWASRYTTAPLLTSCIGFPSAHESFSAPFRDLARRCIRTMSKRCTRCTTLLLVHMESPDTGALGSSLDRSWRPCSFGLMSDYVVSPLLTTSPASVPDDLVSFLSLVLKETAM